MKWNGRPDPGERTRRRVHRNEGHPLPGDARVSGDGLGQAGPGGEATSQSNQADPGRGPTEVTFTCVITFVYSYITYIIWLLQSNKS